MIIDMGYWQRVLKKISILILTIIGIYLAFKLAIFYMPFLIAFIISLLLEPLIRLLMRNLKIGRKASAITVMVTAVIIIGLLLIYGISNLISESTNILQGLNTYFEKAYSIISSFISNLDFSRIQLSQELNDIIQKSALDLLNSASNWLKNIISNLLSIITSIPTIGVYVIICVISLYFICTDKIYMLDQMDHHLPELWVKKLNMRLKEIIKALGNYLKAEATLILITFVISFIGIYIFYFMKLGITYPLTAILSIGFVDALPILGSGTVLVPWAVICGLNGNLKLGIYLIVLWIIISVIRQILEPKIVSNKLGIHPIFTLIAMYTGFKFIGLIGLFIGPIILIVLKNIFSTMIEQGFAKTLFDKK